MVKLTRKSKVKFFPLFTKKEEGEYVVGRSDTEVFIGIPDVGEATIKLLREGKTIGEAEKLLGKKFGSQDLLDFTKTLKDEGFIKNIDGTNIKDKHKKVHHVFDGLKPHHVTWIFSKPMQVIYALLMLLGVAVLLSDLKYLPRARDIFFHDSLTIIYLVSFFLGWILVAAHELFHFFGARSLGVPASFSISSRLIFLVAETDMTDIWEIQPKKRYRAYLAGMAFDLAVIAISLIFVFMADSGIVSLSLLMYKIFKWLILIQMLGIAWQFLFFLETDVYYVIGNYFRIADLQNDTKTFFLNMVRKVFDKKPAKLDRSNKEFRIIKTYASLWGLGTGITFLRFIIYQVPIAVAFSTKAFTRLFAPGSTGDIVDGLVFLGFTVFDYGLLIYGIRKRYHQQDKKFHLGHVLHHLFHYNKHKNR